MLCRSDRREDMITFEYQLVFKATRSGRWETVDSTYDTSDRTGVHVLMKVRIKNKNEILSIALGGRYFLLFSS
jgi:hypothetical protein